MIISLDNKKPVPVRKTNWKTDFRAQLYAANKAAIKQHATKAQDNALKAAQQEAGLKMLRGMKSSRSVRVSDPISFEGCYSYYSSFIPLRTHTRIDSELLWTFPFLKHLEEKGRFNDRDLLLGEISEYIKSCKAESSVMYGWKNCLKRFLCPLDSIASIEIYLELKKLGTPLLPKLHQKYGGGCNLNVFFHRVISASRYFNDTPSELLMPFSIEAGQQINEVSMPKTMKNLFCSICLLYDCGDHEDDYLAKNKEYKFVSPQNVISEERKLQEALEICGMFKEFRINDRLQLDDPCRNQCYRRLERKDWDEIQAKKRGALTSPVVKAVIKLAIEMHGYNPCEIWKMLVGVSPQKDQYFITCSMVFKFLVDEYNLFSKLQRKLCLSEEELLRRVSKGEVRTEVGKKQRRKPNNNNSAASYQKLSACCHYFVGQEPHDLTCQSCSCHERGFCMPRCMCSPKCPIRKLGCKCKKQECTKRCPCWTQKHECDPLICQGCYRQQSKCRNKMITEGRYKKVRIGRSTIPGAGLGLFAGEQIFKDELVHVYAGEIIDQSIDLLRECLSADLTFYNFSSPEGVVDARFMGNATRFINHGNVGENENLRSENVLCKGRYYIGFYATKDIEVDEQLFFNYDGHGELYKNYRDKYPFIKKNNRLSKM